MARSSPHQINIWEVIVSVLEKQDPIVLLAFFGYFYFRLHPSRIATILDVEARVVSSWLSKVQTDIKRAYRASGGVIGSEGSTIAVPIKEILEDSLERVDGDETDS